MAHKLEFVTTINASKEKVRNTMLEDKTYRIWTSAFTEGSYYKGSWEKGSRIVFLDPEGTGMFADIEENIPYEFVSIKHMGLYENGKEDHESEEAQNWEPAFENYAFSEKDGVTTVIVTIIGPEGTEGLDPEYEKMFKNMWPKALKKLKEIAEE